MQLKVKEGIKIKIHNKDYTMGHYYSEDDCSISAVAPTYEEAIKLIIPEYVEYGIWPYSDYMSDVKYVTYNNKQHVIDDTDKTPLIYKDRNIIADIIQHPLFKKLSKEKRERMEAKKAKEVRMGEKIKEKHERELLKQLKYKYGE